MIIDNFLPEEEFKSLQEAIMWKDHVKFNLNSSVAGKDDRNSLDNWYGTSLIYNNSVPWSEHYDHISSIFRPRLEDFVAWIRIKINFYPHTAEIFEHKQHTDCNFSHVAAIYCLNTCDGYTRIGQDTIIESVGNRFYMFDGSIPHNSTTTTNAKGRFNLNFNYVKAQKFL